MSFSQKIKSAFTDDNGNRKHLLPKHRIPQAPAAPAAPLSSAPLVNTQSVPLSSEYLLTQKGLLNHVAEPQTNSFLYNNNGSQFQNQFARSAMVSEGAYVQSAQRSSITAQPTVLETVQKEVVIQERIHPIEKEEIQPIIYREREQLDVRQVTQMLHETHIQPTVLETRELAAEYREAVVEKATPIPENLVLATREVDPVQRSQVVHAPIVNETVKRTVIEEIQPVLERDVFQPTIIQNTQAIYEKIVEAPIVYREVRDMRPASKEFDKSLLWNNFDGQTTVFNNTNSYTSKSTLYQSPSLLGKSAPVAF